MQSEIKNPCGLSPYLLPEEICFSDERQVSLMDLAPGYHGLKAGGILGTAGVASSTMENRIHLDSPIAKGLDLPEYYLSHGQNVNLSSGRNTAGAERAANCSLPSSFDHEQGVRKNLKTESATHLLDRNKLNFMGAQYGNGLFSSSLSDLFSRKLMVQSNNVSFGPSGSVAASYYEGEETVESPGELEALTIGNLLPDDDDLLSGVTDGFDRIVRANDGEYAEDLDLFSTVGGLELGEDGSLQRNSVFSDLSSKNKTRISRVPTCKVHPFEDHPSRTLLVRNISSNAEDSELRMIFEQYGDIRSLYTACKDRGFVMVSYFDIRSARNALEALQDKPLQRWKLDMHFSYPKDNPSEQDINLGALVVSTFDSSISDDELREIFGIYGEIKEIRGTSHRSENKYVEFYDIRAAETAYHALNRSNMSGKQIKLEPGHPGGCKRLMQSFSSELEFERYGLQPQYHSLPNTLTTGFSGSLLLGGASDCTSNRTLRCPCSIAGGPHSPALDNVIQSGESSSVSNSLPSLVGVESRNQSHIGESAGHLRTNLKFELHSMPNLHTHSLPEYQDSLANGPSFGSPINMAANISSRKPEILDNQQFRIIISTRQSSELKEGFVSPGCGRCAPPGLHYTWSNSLQLQPQSIVWPNSPSFVNGIGAALPRHLNAVPRTPSHMLNSLLPLNNHHVGSAPSINLWDRQHTYPGESPDATVFHPGSLGNMRISGNSPHPLEFVPRNMFPRTGRNCMDAPIPSRSNGLQHPPQQMCMIYPARGQMIPVINSFDSPNERPRNRRTDGNLSQTDNKKQFELDVERIAHGEDKRTTLMIKNIPNKYTSKMLLAAIDECHRGAYDFIYLPIDFKNKCNVGYAFINMTDPSFIVPFYQTFNGKKWEKFNSEKVASLAYARIQGKVDLIGHFQNSSLMNEDKRCRPILFHTEGPNAGDQVPFPMSSNIRPRLGKIRASISEEDDQEIPPN